MARALAKKVETSTTLLEAAKNDGRIRADATIMDVRVLLGGCSAQLARFGDRDPALWRRYGKFVLNALRP